MSLGIKRTRPIRVATKTFEGTPAELPGEFENLFAWTRRRNLRVGEPEGGSRAGLAWTAVFHDENDTTPEAARRIDLWIPIDGAGASQPGYAVKDIPHDNVAFMIYKGPMSRLDEAVQQLFTWAEQKQLPFRGRLHRIVYLRGIDGPPEDPDWEAEIQIPLLAMRS
jgi:DNA gyrase inhibitor GyrI